MVQPIGTVIREQLVALGFNIAACGTCGDSWEHALNAWGVELAKRNIPSLIDILRREADNAGVELVLEDAPVFLEYCFSLAEK